MFSWADTPFFIRQSFDAVQCLLTTLKEAGTSRLFTLKRQPLLAVTSRMYGSMQRAFLIIYTLLQ